MALKPVIQLSLVFLIVLVCSCKKDTDENKPTNENTSNIAPCTLVEQNYHLDSIFESPSFWFPQAKYRVRFYDTSFSPSNFTFIEFAFTEKPKTGNYTLVLSLDTTNTSIPNQISFYGEKLGLNYRGGITFNPDYYVESNPYELIISYCDIPEQSYSFDIATNSFVGNEADYQLFRKKI